MDSSPPCFRGYGTRFVLPCVFVPLVLVSLLLLSVDSNGPTPWFSSFSFSLPLHGGGDAHKEKDLESQRGFGAQVSFDRSGHASDVSVPPVAAPSPVQGPAVLLFEHNTTEDAIPLPRGRGKRYTKLQRLELGLGRARAAIKKAFRNAGNRTALPDKDYVPQGPLYRNAYAFHRSYLEMEKLFKVYVYEEGEPPLFHDGPCRSIYSSEGRFINSMEMDSRYRTRNPDLAHVFFLPFSVAKMVKFIYKPESFDISPIKKTIADYIDVVAERYPYWNRSLGADHFMLSCHDWGPHSSKAVPNLYGNSIRVLCNANTSEGFDPSKDVSLPEINIKTDVMADMMGGPSASHRPILAFFAGGDHGPVRPLLLEAWKDKDPDVQVHEYLPKGVSYYDKMRKSKYCLCPSGYEVASPRIVEAIYLGCVPVTINDHYVLPFSDVLDWKAFSVQISVEDIPNIKKILMGISPTQYIRLQRRGAMVQRHFVVNSPPRRFDVFHMILHSIWLRRLNIRMHRPQVSD
ncbi:probable glycosyltransferase At5g03795 [Musa acuminata AAA Group]|uniref:probable glycosyltransferase At5g03795 n=1 Tax=Musa acuminata AAA Group TaxID=214697 RepID=UPI0031DFE953